MVALHRAVTPQAALAATLLLALAVTSVHATGSHGATGSLRAHHAAPGHNHTEGDSEHGRENLDSESAKPETARALLLPFPSPKPETFDFFNVRVVVSGSSTAKTATATFTVRQTGGPGICRACYPRPITGHPIAADWTISGCVTNYVHYTGKFYSGPNGVTTISLPLDKPPAGCKSYGGVLRLAFATRFFNDVPTSGMPYTPAARVVFNVPVKW